MNSDFKNVLMQIIETGQIPKDYYVALSDDDKKIIDLLFSNHIIYKLHNQEEIDKLINRFNIIKGEIMIGNNNPEILKELKILVLTLMDNNVLTLREINNILRYLFYLI